MLYIEDLLDAFDAAAAGIAIAKGSIYNVGGGIPNAISLLELIDVVSKRLKKALPYTFAAARQGDQRIYVSDIRKIESDLNWKPRVGWQEGVGIVHDWVRAHREECVRALGVSANPPAGQ